MKIFVDKDTVCATDHLGGFNQSLKSTGLDNVIAYARSQRINNICTGYVFDNQIQLQYPEFNFVYQQYLVGGHGWEDLFNYKIHPVNSFNNFLCSFNGSAHVGRRLLVAILQKFGYFDPGHCSKNFSYTTDILDGHISDYVDTHSRFYRKFFIPANSEEFFQKIYSFGHVRFKHGKNIYNLENKLTQSFVHVVSETMATSYYPFVTEKFLYSIVTRGLFLSYAPPGWHGHIEKYYGFKKYTKLFDYRFDTIQNPIERLIELISMISKFSTLSIHDWNDLYLMEQDAIEYNYNHYFSGDYLKHIKNQFW